MSKQKAAEAEAEVEPTDAEKHYALHADPNRERWLGGVTDPPGEPAPAPPGEIGGGINLPKATGLDPPGCAIDDPDMLLVVHGLNFSPDTLIVFDGTAVLTNALSDTELNCEFHPSALLEARGYPVTVKQGRYVAPTATMFTVTEPAARKGKKR